MTPKYYRPKRKGDLTTHLLRDHANDVLSLAKGMTMKDLEKVVLAQSVYWVLVSPEIRVSDAALFLAPWRKAGMPLPKGYPGG